MFTRVGSDPYPDVGIDDFYFQDILDMFKVP
jgi:hypothetical protein